MLWITWRQHRTALLSTLGFAVAVSALLLWMWQAVVEVNAACAQHDCWLGAAGAAGGRLTYLYAALNLGQPALAGLIAVFWGAPLLAREYEQRTYQLAWSQDVTPLRWFGRKVALLGVAVVLCSAVLAAASWTLVDAMKSGGSFAMSDYRALELWPVTQVMYALFGFALGLAVGLIAKRTVLAMGITLVVFAAVRFLIADTVLWWWAPVSVSGGDRLLPPDAYQLGNSLDRELLYQPIERLATFRWTEVIAYALLTVMCAGVAWTVVRRATRVG